VVEEIPEGNLFEYNSTPLCPRRFPVTGCGLLTGHLKFPNSGISETTHLPPPTIFYIGLPFLIIFGFGKFSMAFRDFLSSSSGSG
jgi:hypothetical protein